MSQTEKESVHWLQAMSEGSTEAFDRFYDRYSGLVYRLALKMTGNRMDAEDICHDVFLEAFQRAEQYDPARGSVDAWLVIKTKSRSLDLLRQRQRRTAAALPDTEEYNGDTMFDPAEQAELRLAGETVKATLNRLPVQQRQAIFGVFYAGHTHRELAQEMKRPLGTVKSFVRYGLLNIKKQLAELGWAEKEELETERRSSHGRPV